jgi:hypothetical protein
MRHHCSVIRHTVLLKFVDETDAAEAALRLDSLRGRVPALLSLSVALDVTHGDGSYHLVLVTTHVDLPALGAYAADPAHLDVLEWLRPRLSARAVVDSLE